MILIPSSESINIRCLLKERCQLIIWNVLGGVVVKLISVLLPEACIEGLDELVKQNMYSSRSATIRVAVRDLLKRELWARP